MKKLKFFLFIAIVISISTLSVYADEEYYGVLEITADVDDSLKGTVNFSLKNTLTNTVYSFSLSYLNGYYTNKFVLFGPYQLVDYIIYDNNRKIVDGKVELEDFEVGMENPNGNWNWYLKPVVTYTPNKETETTTKKKTDKTDKEEKTTKKEEEKTTEQLVIPTDNKYFPGMTLNEIKKWYTNEVTAFNKEGGKSENGRSLTLEEFQGRIKDWADASFDNKKYSMQIKYQAMVDGYDTDETRHFYEVQKKMYDFIKEYQNEHKVYLNFIKWDVAEEPTSSTDKEPTSKQEETTSIEESTSKQEETTSNVEEQTSTEKKGADSDDKNDSSFWGKLKDMWLTATIFIVALIGTIIFKIKYAKRED